jgi:hypothetical protein
MKLIPFVHARTKLEAGRTYIKSWDQGDRIRVYGPVEGLQITCGNLRDTSDGATFGHYDQTNAQWHIYTPDGYEVYTDIVPFVAGGYEDTRKSFEVHVQLTTVENVCYPGILANSAQEAERMVRSGEFVFYSLDDKKQHFAVKEIKERATE